jgi:hypothetical protein
MVARPPDYDELRNQISQREQEQQNSTATTTSSVRDSLQSLFALSSLLGGSGGNGEQSANTHLSRSGDRSEINPSPEISTSLEPIRQSLLTMHTLLSTMNTTTGENRERTLASEPNTRKYFVGQWLDVKDTVNQWLEATVMQIDHEQNRIFVHYNGW